VIAVFGFTNLTTALVGSTIILKWILKIVMWSECIWIRIGIGGGLLWIIRCGVFDSASPEDPKDVSHVVRSQGRTMYSGCSRHFHPNCRHRAAICWALWGLCTKRLYSMLKRNILVVTDDEVTRKVPEAVSRWFCLQSTEFCAEGMHSLITRCDECVNFQGDYVEL
jgi:hypothetical protein